MSNKEIAIKMLEEIQNNDALINKGNILQDIQDVMEFISNNL